MRGPRSAHQHQLVAARIDAARYHLTGPGHGPERSGVIVEHGQGSCALERDTAKSVPLLPTQYDVRVLQRPPEARCAAETPQASADKPLSGKLLRQGTRRRQIHVCERCRKSLMDAALKVHQQHVGRAVVVPAYSSRNRPPLMIQTGHLKRREKHRQDDAGSPTTMLPGTAACTATHATRDRAALARPPTSMISRRPTPTGRNRPFEPVANVRFGASNFRK